MSPGNDNADVWAFIALIAQRYEVPVDDVIREIQGRSILGRVFRDVFGIDDPTPAKKRRGLKPHDNLNWRLFVYVEFARRSGRKIDEAIEEFTGLSGETGTGTGFENAKRQYHRLKKKWNSSDVPDGLAALFVGPPPADGK